jgi:glycosyltransferase involved in cell wall biosynthesis
MTPNSNASLNKIKLLHIQLLPILSGVQNVTVNEFSSLNHEKYELHLICKEYGPLSECVRHLGVSVHYCSSLVRPISLFSDLAALLELYKIIKKIDPDVVHTHSSKTGILGRLASRFAGVKSVLHTVHGFAFPFAKSRTSKALYTGLEYLSAKICDGLIVLNKSDYDVARNVLHVPASKIHLVPNGVDSSQLMPPPSFQRQVFRKEIFKVNTNNDIIVGMVGRLWQQKNPEILIRSAAALISRGSHNLKFIFVGEGELQDECVQLAESLQINKHLIFLGWREDVALILNSIDIFVLPSLWEGMPLAILEAMACSLPVVASNISGNNDLVEHGINGYLFETNNHVDLTAKLGDLIFNSELRREFGLRAKTKVVNYFSLDSRNQHIEKIYHCLLN